MESESIAAPAATSLLEAIEWVEFDTALLTQAVAEFLTRRPDALEAGDPFPPDRARLELAVGHVLAVVGALQSASPQLDPRQLVELSGLFSQDEGASLTRFKALAFDYAVDQAIDLAKGQEALVSHLRCVKASVRSLAGGRIGCDDAGFWNSAVAS